jgi:hypothetical protein
LDFFNLPNPSSRTMALGLTWPLTEMSTRNFSWGGGEKWLAHKVDNLTTTCELIIQVMWEPRHPTTLWSFTSCYRDSLTFFNIFDVTDVMATAISLSLRGQTEQSYSWLIFWCSMWMSTRTQVFWLRFLLISLVSSDRCQDRASVSAQPFPLKSFQLILLQSYCHSMLCIRF